MSLEVKVLQPSQAQEILIYERAKLPAELDVPAFATWDAVWREESLEHYLPLGWSFGAWKGTKLVGYCLTQPLLFFRGMTQSLWVEHVAFDTSCIGVELVGIMIQWGRSKHIPKSFVSTGRAGRAFEGFVEI